MRHVAHPFAVVYERVAHEQAADAVAHAAHDITFVTPLVVRCGHRPVTSHGAPRAHCSAGGHQPLLFTPPNASIDRQQKEALVPKACGVPHDGLERPKKLGHDDSEMADELDAC